MEALFQNAAVIMILNQCSLYLSLQVTGKKVYSATCFVASAFKSDSKVVGVVPDVSLDVSDVYLCMQNCRGNKQGSETDFVFL